MYNLQHTIKKTLFIFLLNLIGITTAFSQGFSIELQDWKESWRHAQEDLNGNIVSLGWFRDSPTSVNYTAKLKVHAANGVLLKERSLNAIEFVRVNDFLVTDSTYVVFVMSPITPNSTKLIQRSIHYNHALTNYHIKTWGDTVNRYSIDIIKPATHGNGWYMSYLENDSTNRNIRKNVFKHLSNDFNTEIKSKSFSVPTDSTDLPGLQDIIGLPNNQGYALLFNGVMLGDTMLNIFLHSIIIIDSNMNEMKRILAESYPGSTTTARFGVLSFSGRAQFALESDSTLLLYGCAKFYNYNPWSSNFCMTDTCVRQIRTRWSLPDLQLVGATVSPWIGKPAYHEGVELLGGTRHLVWGSIGRDDRVKNGLQDYETGISIEEWTGNQRNLRRELSQNGYWFRPSSVKKARNGDYIITSRQNNFLNNGNIEHQPMLARVDSAGQFLVFSENLVEVPVKVWPNPVNGRVLKLDLVEEGESRVTLLDLQGRMLEQQPFSEKNSQLDLSAYPAGLYLLRIQQTGKAPKTVKLVLP